ncbi:MAG TPA: prepilin peptidase [Gaiellaceae bacterium]|jgi:leader peptidase (prepilin peptidase)/N-methyltransferase
MAVALGAFAVLPGLAVGSFLNVVATRLPERRSLREPRSACRSCETPIAWYDNVPVLSYVLLRGRCRSCRARISPLYPAVEVATALLLAGCILVFGLTLQAAAAAVFCAALVVITATDLTHRIVPNRVVLPAAAVVLVLMTAAEPSPEWAIAGVGAATFLLVVALAYPGGMGMGDVKLALLMGVALGRAVAVALPLGMIAAIVPAIFLFARYGSGARKMAIPFAPFLAVGSIVALFAGDALIRAYTSLL